MVRMLIWLWLPVPCMHLCFARLPLQDLTYAKNKQILQIFQQSKAKFIAELNSATDHKYDILFKVAYFLSVTLAQKLHKGETYQN
jgi:hypothetical protein